MTQDLVSIGKLAETLQRAPLEIDRGLADLEIGASLSLNDLSYFDRDVVDRLRGYFYNLSKGD